MLNSHAGLPNENENGSLIRDNVLGILLTKTR